MEADFSALLLKFGIFLVLFVVGLAFGRHNERKHLAELARNEQRLAYISVSNFRQIVHHHPGQMVCSNVVISHDYFKYVIANIHNLVGGRLKSYESIVERARREAIVRLKQQAENMGATHIEGLRLATTELGMEGGMVEVFAYGTAIIAAD